MFALGVVVDVKANTPSMIQQSLSQIRLLRLDISVHNLLLPRASSTRDGRKQQSEEHDHCAAAFLFRYPPFTLTTITFAGQAARIPMGVRSQLDLYTGPYIALTSTP